MATDPASPGPLAGIKVLDLSRVLAGPWSTQMLGDLGAEIFKIEQPGHGDDTRGWGPPFLDDGSRDSAYYLCANRNKRSVAIDIATPEGQELIRRFAGKCDIVVENFRVGGLAKYGLDYAVLSAINPRLVYCSITGFGQDGPYKDRGGYDFLIQGMSGLMSVTGEPDGPPMKTGIPITDLSTGLYATVAILAGLHHATKTGEGQHIDLALLDTQVALLANQASNYLHGGARPRRMANEHPNMVPYRDFACSDGEIIVALGNDRQFRAFAAVLGRGDLADDPRFADLPGRSANRTVLHAELTAATMTWTSADLLAALDAAKLPGGRVNEIPEVLDDPQIAHRDLVQALERPDGTTIRFLGFPAKLSATPAAFTRAPPRTGEHTGEVLRELLGMGADEIAALQAGRILGG